MPVEEKSFNDIPISPRLREPHGYEALPMTAGRVPYTHNSANRAATLFDNLRSTRSSTGLASTPFSAPYTLEQPHIIDTSVITSASTQSETHAQLALQQWNSHGYESDPIPTPNHWTFHDSASSTTPIGYDDTHYGLVNGDSAYPNDLYGLAAQFAHNSSDADGFMQHTNEATDFATGITGDCTLPELTEFSLDAPTQSTADSQLESHLVGPTPLSWAHNDLGLWLPRVDYASAEPAASSAEPPNIFISPPRGKSTESGSKYCNLCPPGKGGRLACLFSKYDPEGHPTCLSKHFGSISHLKQHLVHSHKLGEHHCTSCWRTFETAEMLTSHGHCMPTGGKPVDKLPGFPKTRIPRDKKWYWCWRQLFGEAATLPDCPFHHPWDDVAAYVQARSLSQLGYVGRGYASQNASLSFSDREHTPLSTPSDQPLVGDENYLGIQESGLFGQFGGDFPTTSSELGTNASATTYSWDLGFDDV